MHCCQQRYLFLGSIISILTRIDKINSFPNQDPNYQQEADPLLPIFLGAFKPIIGASFGLLIFALINSGIVTIPAIQNEDNRQREFFFCSIAFIVGFSERLAKDIITKAENALSSSGNSSPSPELVTDIAKMKANLSELESRLQNNNGNLPTIPAEEHTSKIDLLSKKLGLKPRPSRTAFSMQPTFDKINSITNLSIRDESTLSTSFLPYQPTKKEFSATFWLCKSGI